MLVLKPQLFVSIRGPNRKTLPIDKHGNGVVYPLFKTVNFDETLL